jgi:hypothetical protein
VDRSRPRFMNRLRTCSLAWAARWSTLLQLAVSN